VDAATWSDGARLHARFGGPRSRSFYPTWPARLQRKRLAVDQEHPQLLTLFRVGAQPVRPAPRGDCVPSPRERSETRSLPRIVLGARRRLAGLSRRAPADRTTRLPPPPPTSTDSGRPTRARRTSSSVPRRVRSAIGTCRSRLGTRRCARWFTSRRASSDDIPKRCGGHLYPAD